MNIIGKKYNRPWGYYKTLEIKNNFQVKIIYILPLQQISLQKHLHREEYWTIIEGKALIQNGKKKENFVKGNSIFIKKESIHRAHNTSKNNMLKILELQIGEYLGEDDIIRIEDIYNRK